MSVVSCVSGRPVQREGLVCRSLDDESVLYDPAHHTVHYLNQTASLVWLHCDGRHEVDDIAAVLIDAFEAGADPEACRAIAEDVHGTIEQLLSNGLIDRNSAGGHLTEHVAQV